jgi:hypothetical protein
MSRAGSILALALAAAATVATDVAVLFFPQSSTDSLAILFVPVYLTIGVGLMIGADSVVRALAGRIRSRSAPARGGS